MTVEQAVEIVLGPHEWVACPQCEGGQLRRTSPVLDVKAQCQVCSGSGGVLSDEHALAHRITDTPYPSPWTVKRVANGTVHVSGPPIYVGKLQIKPTRWFISDGNADLIEEAKKL